MVVLQVFYQLATQHLSSVSEWSEDPPIIQIGGGRFTTCSQADFLTRCVVAYENSRGGRTLNNVSLSLYHGP